MESGSECAGFAARPFDGRRDVAKRLDQVRCLRWSRWIWRYSASHGGHLGERRHHLGSSWARLAASCCTPLPRHGCWPTEWCFCRRAASLAVRWVLGQRRVQRPLELSGRFRPVELAGPTSWATCGYLASSQVVALDGVLPWQWRQLRTRVLVRWPHQWGCVRQRSVEFRSLQRNLAADGSSCGASCAEGQRNGVCAGSRRHRPVRRTLGNWSPR